MTDNMLPEHFAEAINNVRNLRHILVMRGWDHKERVEDVKGLEEDLRNDLWLRFEIQIP